VLEAMSRAQNRQCSQAVDTVDHLAEPVADLPFTQDGLESFLHSARFSYLTGTIYKTCGMPEKAESNFHRASEQSNLESALWSWKASQEFPNFNPSAAKQKLQNLLARSKNNSGSGAESSSWLYSVAMLDRALGNHPQAEKEFHDALLAPDQLSTYHLTRLALSGKE